MTAELMVRIAELVERVEILEQALRLTRTRDEHVWNCRIDDGCKECHRLTHAVVDARCAALGDEKNPEPGQ